MSSKTNCACNAQAYYVDRRCTNYSVAGYTSLKVDDATIARMVSGEVILASDVNTVKNQIRSLVKLYNQNDTFVQARGSSIPLSEATDYTSSLTIKDTQFNRIVLMGTRLGGTYGSSGYVADGDTIKDDEWIALINSFNTSTENCLCNTDCYCNEVCSIVSDCGCNY